MEIIFSSKGTVQSQYKLPIAQARKIEAIIKETLTEMPVALADASAQKPKKELSPVMKEIKQSLRDVKKMREGKLPEKDIQSFLDEL